MRLPTAGEMVPERVTRPAACFCGVCVYVGVCVDMCVGMCTRVVNMQGMYVWVVRVKINVHKIHIHPHKYTTPTVAPRSRLMTLYGKADGMGQLADVLASGSHCCDCVVCGVWCDCCV